MRLELAANTSNGSSHSINSKIYRFYDFKPSIVSINDVPNDQGRFVRIIWNHSGLDTAGTNHTIAMYGVWRRLDEELMCNETVKIQNIEYRDKPWARMS